MSEEEVIQYLSKKPNFFVKHLDVLEGLTLPHPVNGKVISLLEYQVHSLKESTSRYRSQFDRLVEVARDNESSMQKSRRLILASLHCQSLDDIAVVIDDMVRDDFEASHHALIFFDERLDCAVRTHDLSKKDVFLDRTASFDECYCGVLPSEEMTFIFGSDASDITSVAIIPLVSKSDGVVRKIGVLVLGGETSSLFDRSKGVMFLQYIADLLSAILQRLVP